MDGLNNWCVMNGVNDWTVDDWSGVDDWDTMIKVRWSDERKILSF